MPSLAAGSSRRRRSHAPLPRGPIDAHGFPVLRTCFTDACALSGYPPPAPEMVEGGDDDHRVHRHAARKYGRTRRVLGTGWTCRCSTATPPMPSRMSRPSTSWHDDPATMVPPVGQATHDWFVRVDGVWVIDKHPHRHRPHRAPPRSRAVPAVRRALDQVRALDRSGSSRPRSVTLAAQDASLPGRVASAAGRRSPRPRCRGSALPRRWRGIAGRVRCPGRMAPHGRSWSRRRWSG